MEEAIASLHAMINISGIAFNIVLIFLVIKHTPKEIRTYSIVIFNYGACDLVACISSVFIRQRIVFNSPTIFYISSGPCCWFRTAACATLYNIWLHCASYSLYILVLLFAYRYYILFKPLPRIQTIVVTMVFLYIPSGIQLGLAFFTLKIEGDVRKYLNQIVTYDLTNKCVSAYMNLHEWKSLVIELHLSVLILPVYVAILILRKKTISKLNVGWMSDRTLHMHSQMLKAITYQACLPLLLSSGLLVFVLGQILGPNHSSLQHSYIAASLTPVLSPLLTLYFIKPYNDWLKTNIFCWNIRKISSVSASSVANASHHTIIVR